MLGKKGQAAMEYLMTYGWAILVVMVVGIAMWRLGIFNMGAGPMTASGFAKIKPQIAASGFSRADPGAAFGATATMVFTNGVGTNIRIGGPGTSGWGFVVNRTDAGANFSSGRWNCVDVSANLGNNLATAAARCGVFTTCVQIAGGGCGPVGAGENFMIAVNNLRGGGAASSYQADVSIEYMVTIGTATNAHMDSGSIHGTLE